MESRDIEMNNSNTEEILLHNLTVEQSMSNNQDIKYVFLFEIQIIYYFILFEFEHNNIILY